MSRKSSYVSALSPEYVLLGLIDQESDHGYRLHKRLLSELEQIWHISLSQTYNILNRLEEEGFIIGSLEEQQKLPSKRKYLLSDSGHRRFETWLQTPTGRSVRAIRVEFTTRLYFAAVRNKEFALRLIKEQIEETRLGLSQLQEKQKKLSPENSINKLGLDLRIRQLCSILDWLAFCRQTIEAQF